MRHAACRAVCNASLRHAAEAFPRVPAITLLTTAKCVVVALSSSYLL